MKNAFLFLRFLLLVFLLSCNQPSETAVLIHAVMYDGFELANRDEMVILINISDEPVDLSGWQITDNETGTVFLPSGTTVEPGEKLWLTKNGMAVSNWFHHVVDFELQDSHLLINDLNGVWPTLSDEGDAVVLLNEDNQIMDALVYKSEITFRVEYVDDVR